jgi:hypothetical protein
MAALNMSVIVVDSVLDSTLVVCDVADSYDAPLAANQKLGDIIVEPEGWAGALALQGADKAKFAISVGGGKHSLVVGDADLPGGTYSFTIEATP